MSTAAVRSQQTAQKYSAFFLASFGLFVLASILAVCGVAFSIATGTVQDWISYWATGQRLAQHLDPYDSAAIVQLERAHGLDPRVHPLIARNPPSALWTMAPLGRLSFYTGGLLWRLLQALLLGICVHLLWVQSGRTRGRWHLLAYLFIGSIACVSSGQSTIFALLGAVLFMPLHERRPFLAGAALSLCAFKPHLFLPFAVVLLLWIVQKRMYRLVLGLCTAVAGQLLLAWWMYPHVFASYAHAMVSDGIEDQYMPAIAVALRFWIARHAMWLGFLPAILGCAWATWHFARNRKAWNWSQELPLLLFVSLLAAPYAWIVDSVLAVPAIVSVAPRCSESSRAALLLLMSAAILQYCLSANMDSPKLLWQIPAFFAWYLYGRTTTNRPASMREVEPLTCGVIP